jgi:hypothetical protein
MHVLYNGMHMTHDVGCTCGGCCVCPVRIMMPLLACYDVIKKMNICGMCAGVCRMHHAKTEHHEVENYRGITVMPSVCLCMCAFEQANITWSRGARNLYLEPQHHGSGGR